MNLALDNGFSGAHDGLGAVAGGAGGAREAILVGLARNAAGRDVFENSIPGCFSCA